MDTTNQDDKNTLAKDIDQAMATVDSSTEQADDTTPTATLPPVIPAGSQPANTMWKLPEEHGFKHFIRTPRGIALLIVLGLLLLIGLLFAIPPTRYGIMGMFVRKDVILTLRDADADIPVIDAKVKIGSAGGFSDAQGTVRIKDVPVGNYTITIEKQYYETRSDKYIVPITSAPRDLRPKLRATGKQFKVNVKNKINHNAIKDAEVVISDSKSITDGEGNVITVLPVKTSKQLGTVAAKGYISTPVEVQVTNGAMGSLNVELMPDLTLYYLSKYTGTIDIVKSKLDGNGVETVLKGTGKESDTETLLIASRDWKYLALITRRDGETAKVYLVRTANNQLETMDDSANQTFEPVGWVGNRFVYKTYRINGNAWEGKSQSLRSFNVDNNERKVLDETQAKGTNNFDFATENVTTVSVVNDKLVYGKFWYGGSSDAEAKSKKRAVVYRSADGSGAGVAREFDQATGTYMEQRLLTPIGLYLRLDMGANKPEFYKYNAEKVVSAPEIDDSGFYAESRRSYLVSPDGKRTFWHERRNGRSMLLVGDKDGKATHEVGLSDYTAYGWLTDQYLIVSKGSNELFVLAVDGRIDDKTPPLRIGYYHNPKAEYPGYGWGYGAQ